MNLMRAIIVRVLVSFSLVSCSGASVDRMTTHARLVELVPIEVDRKRVERRNFGALTLLSAFQLASKDKRFGGLSGLSVGPDGRLYAVSDHGFWLSASMLLDPDGALKDLVDWRIAPILTTTKLPVRGSLRDAEALAQARDGSFLVAFEGLHRIWRYSPPPRTFESTPVSVQIPSAVAQAPSNGGIEALATLADGRLLIIAEEGFRVTDCAALNNGDVLVLERRYVPFGILSARLTRVKAGSLRPGAKLAGKELLKLEQPLAVENFEGIAVQQTSNGTMIFIVSDDNYSSFQQTLLLQFLLPDFGP
jgi:hypothetical protein